MGRPLLIVRLVVGAAVFSALLVGGLWLRAAWEDRQLARRLATIHRDIAAVRIAAPPCAPGARCECRIVGHSDAFTRCEVVEGHPALWIRSPDSCFSQWIVVNYTWPVNGLGERLAMYWIREQPRQVTPGWSLLAISPCLD